MMALVAVLIMIIANEVAVISKAGIKITCQEAVLKFNREGAIFLDTRGQNDFDSAHIVGAISMPAAYAQERISTLAKYKDKILIYYTQSGADPQAIGRLLKKEGFAHFFELEGGYDGWIAQNMPIEKKRAKKRTK